MNRKKILSETERIKSLISLNESKKETNGEVGESANSIRQNAIAKHGWSEKSGQLSDGGEVNGDLSQIINELVADFSKTNPGCKGKFTAGNDKFHHGIKSYTSRHTKGEAVDVTLPSNCHSDFVSLLRNYKSKYHGFSYIDEYRNPTSKATGGHFHISYRKGRPEGGGGSGSGSSGSGSSGSGSSDVGSSSSSSSSSTSGSQSTTGDTFIKAILSPYMSALGLNEQFLNPTSSTRKIKLDSKRVDFPAQSGGRVYSPYEGVVSKVSNSDCNGTVEIKINLDKEYYIVVCNVDPKQNVGDNVSAGEIIGHAKGDSIQLEVKDSGGKKYKLSQFFKDKKTDNEKDKKLKGDDVKPFELSKAHLSIMRAPLDIAKYVVSGVYNNIKSQNSRASSRDEISENINLKEELIRIKKLMN